MINITARIDCRAADFPIRRDNSRDTSNEFRNRERHVSKEAVAAGKPPSPAPGPKLRSTNLNFFYGAFQALHESAWM